LTRRLAYADPPYPGQARGRYRGGSEVNLPLLVEYLRSFDGWALSTSTPALREVWNLCPEARCASWVKTYAANGWSRVRYSWEPVLFVSDRRGVEVGAPSSGVRDALVAAPVTAVDSWQEVRGRGAGAKPPAFTAWLLDLLDVEEGDDLLDVFPGSGGVARAAGARQLEAF